MDWFLGSGFRTLLFIFIASLKWRTMVTSQGVKSDLSKYFCANFEFIDTGNMAIRYHTACLDQERRIMRFDRTVPNRGPATEIYDYKTGIKHTYHKQDSTCDFEFFDPKNGMEFPIDENHWVKIDDMFHVDITYQRSGYDRVRDGVVPVAVYKKIPQPGVTWTHTWYLSLDDWTFFKTHPERQHYDNPMKVVTSALDGSWNLTSNLWDGDITRPFLQKFDVGNCYVQGRNIPRTYKKLDFTISFNRGDYILNTDGDFKYTYMPINMFQRTGMVISVKACKNAHIALSKTLNNYQQDTYEIVIGGWENQKSAIRIQHGGTDMTQVDTPGILNCNQLRAFWITWKDGVIQLGRGTDNTTGLITRYRTQNPIPVNAFGVATEGATGQWKFINTRTDTDNLGFEVDMNTPDKVDDVIVTLSNKTEIPLLRFSQSRLDITFEKIYMTSTLLPNPPIIIPEANDCPFPGPDCVDVRLISNEDAWKLISTAVNNGDLVVNFSNGLSVTAEGVRRDILRTDRGDIGNDPYLAKFAQDARRMVFVDPSKTIYGVNLQECARRCILSRSLKCESFNFCPNVGDCLLSTMHAPENEDKGSYKNHSFCDHYTRSYVQSHFTHVPGKVILRNNDKTLNDQSAESCAKSCLDENSFRCESFDYCPDIRECTMSKQHKDNSDTKLVDKKSCEHYSRSILGQFRQIQNKLIVKNNDLYIGNTSEENCAKACVEESGFTCKSFDYCSDSQQGIYCVLSRVSLGDISGSDVSDSAQCSIYERMSTATRIQTKGFSAGAAAGLSIGMIILGALLGAGILFAVVWKRNQNAQDGMGNELVSS